MKKIISLFLILCIVPLSGCARIKTQLNELSLVLCSGIDLSEDGRYLYTVQVLNTQGSPKSNGGNKTQSTSINIFTSEGYTITEAFNNASIISGKPLFFSHSRMVVVGERLAKHGLSDMMDKLFRHYNIRPDGLLFVTKGTAKDIVSTYTPDQGIPAEKLRSMSMQQRDTGYSISYSRLDFIEQITNKSHAASIGLINLRPDQKFSNRFDLYGAGVFKKNKLVGYLDASETRGLQWVNGKIINGSVRVSLPNGKMVVFDILNSESNIKPIINGNDLTMEINIKEESLISETNDNINLMKHYKQMNKLAAFESDAIKREVSSTLAASQNSLKTDIFGLGDEIYAKKPKYWKTIENNWDKIYPHVKVKINVKCIVRRPGIVSKPILE
ncbi:Ger(x)C family spore germination protein [Clostridium felsineum]|uniref:Ger(x)C family spore germination protein n=1 Tax=Clostridium felsineum TaxID=36839 RepID=UPI00098CCFE0|nr:Ger(x)C family spore germination protein [Clostridium felsineum]URZ14583.1 Spore germination protein B3 [Clostridium felsineum DSM 794]